MNCWAQLIQEWTGVERPAVLSPASNAALTGVKESGSWAAESSWLFISWTGVDLAEDGKKTAWKSSSSVSVLEVSLHSSKPLMDSVPLARFC